MPLTLSHEVTEAGRDGQSLQPRGQIVGLAFARKIQIFLNGVVYSLTKGLLMGVPVFPFLSIPAAVLSSRICPSAGNRRLWDYTENFFAQKGINFETKHTLNRRDSLNTVLGELAG
jgi:hypothetical protein